MKTSKKIALLALSGLLAINLLVPACSTTAETRTYQTAKATAVTVESAMRAWGNYVAAFHPPASEETKVKMAYDRYRAAMLLVADAGKAYSEGVASGDSLNAAVQGVTASINDLVNLIESFGIVIK